MQQINSFLQPIIHERAGKRTNRVIMTDEARVLKKMREDRGYSMRKLGELLSKSDSYISQVENGRMDVPKDEALEHYLTAFGEMNIKSFNERVRRFRMERNHTDRDELLEIAKRATEAQVRNIVMLARTILATEMK